jgi:hypothetical protein
MPLFPFSLISPFAGTGIGGEMKSARMLEHKSKPPRIRLTLRLPISFHLALSTPRNLRELIPAIVVEVKANVAFPLDVCLIKERLSKFPGPVLVTTGVEI